jgi:hypothetical protein
MAIHNEDEKRGEDLDEIQQRIDQAKKSTTDRSEKVDDLTSRFRELRRKNHFRLMLEEIFND